MPHAASHDVLDDASLRTREEKSLPESHAEVAEGVELFAPFDPFRDDIDRERAREKQQRFHRCAPSLMAIDLA